MVSEILLFIFALLVTAFLLFVLIYFLITLSDLECDYLNAQECCAKLNFVRNVSNIYCASSHSSSRNPFCSGTSRSSGSNFPSFFFCFSWDIGRCSW